MHTEAVTKYLGKYKNVKECIFFFPPKTSMLNSFILLALCLRLTLRWTPKQRHSSATEMSASFRELVPARLHPPLLRQLRLGPPRAGCKLLTRPEAHQEFPVRPHGLGQPKVPLTLALKALFTADSHSLTNGTSPKKVCYWKLIFVTEDEAHRLTSRQIRRKITILIKVNVVLNSASLRCL